MKTTSHKYSAPKNTGCPNNMVSRDNMSQSENKVAMSYMNLLKWGKLQYVTIFIKKVT